MLLFQQVEFTTTRANPGIDPGLHAWGWEVPIDLFLAALAGGVAILHAMVVLSGKQDRFPTIARFAPWLPPVALGLALGALFLDLEYKIHLFRFFTTFQPSSPMSWGSWLYMGFGLSSVATGWLHWKGETQRRLLWANLVLGFGLVVYTGVLLSAIHARPSWNSPVLLPMFLITALLSAVAVAELVGRVKRERRDFAIATTVLLAAEAFLIAVYCIHLATSGSDGANALTLIFGGPYTAVFWSIVVAAGTLLPLLLEAQAWRQRWPATRVAPALILVGALALRFVLVQAGQHIGV